MRRHWLSTGTLLAFVAMGHAQMLGEFDAAQQGMNDLNSAQVAPAGGQIALDRAQAVAAPGAVGGPGDPTLGLAPPPPLGLAAPGAPAPATAAFPGLGGPQPGFPQGAGQPGAVATPTPIPEIRVLTGQRVFDAVTNALLDDPAYISRPQAEQDQFFDDGIRDNGIANDGVRGNVETIKGQFIGAETNSIKNRTINLVRNAEELSPMVFFGYHIMAVDPTTQHRDMPNLLQKEAQHDELLRDWNARFLADFRKDKNDPRSEYFDLYVPNPPALPRFPKPPGYVAPQKLAPGQTPALGVVAPVVPVGAFGDPGTVGDTGVDPTLNPNTPI